MYHQVQPSTFYDSLCTERVIEKKFSLYFWVLKANTPWYKQKSTKIPLYNHGYTETTTNLGEIIESPQRTS